MGPSIILFLIPFRTSGSTWVVVPSLKLLLLLVGWLLLLLELRREKSWRRQLGHKLHLLHWVCRCHRKRRLSVRLLLRRVWLLLCRWVRRWIHRRWLMLKWASLLLLVLPVRGTLLVVVAKRRHAELLLQLGHLGLHGLLSLHGGRELLGEHGI